MGRGKWYNKWVNKRGFMIENIKLNKKSSVYAYFPKANQYGFQDGNIRGLIYADAVSRYQRMNDLNVLFPVGFHSLGATSFLQSKKKSNNLDDEISDIFHAQMMELGIGINKNKLIDMRHDEFIINLQLLFIELYEKKYINYKDTYVYYDEVKQKIYDDFSLKKVGLERRREKCFTLNIKNILSDVIKDIDNLEIADEYKRELKKYFLPCEVMILNLGLSNGESLEMEITNPEYLGALSAVLINPDLCDISKFISAEEKIEIENILANDEGYAYSGVDAFNQLNGEMVPVFISRIYNEKIHLCFPAIDDDDYAFCNECELDVHEIIGADQTLINSDFLDGLMLEEAHNVALNSFIEDGIIEKRLVYKVDEILLSSEDSFGPLFPFLYDQETNTLNSLKDYLPYNFSTKFRPVTKGFSDVSGEMLNGTINNLFVEGMSPFICLTYDVYSQVESFFLNSTNELFNEWLPYELFIVEENNLQSELLMPIIFYNIFKRELKLPNSFIKNIKIVGKSVDNRLNDIRRSNNNLIDIDKLLLNYYADSIRLFVLSDKLKDQFVFNGYELKSIDEYVKKIENALANITLNDKQVDLTFQDYKNKALNLFNKYEIDKYIKVIKEITNKYIFENNICKDDLLIYLKLIYPIMPYLAEEMYERHFDMNKSIINESW